MQAIKFLDSLIIEKNHPDAEWIELKWNPVIQQMWQGFKLNRAKRKMVADYMEKQRKGRILCAIEQDSYWNLYYGWDVHDYTMSVDDVFDKIKDLLS